MQGLQRPFAAPHPDLPSFMGAASRKRKWEIAAERGLIPPLGHSPEAQQHMPFPNAHPGNFGPQPPRAAPPAGLLAGYGASVFQRQVAPTKGGKGMAVVSGGKAWGKGCKGGKGEEDDDGFIAPTRSAAKRGAAAPAVPSQARAATGKGAGRHPGAQGSVMWITLPDSAPFVLNGYPELGPAVFYNANIQNLLTSGQYILPDLGVAPEAVVFHDDPDWNQYPEVAASIKAAGGEETCLCVAECSERAIWAVGGAGNWKRREQAARLAICVALAANAEDFTSLAVAHPEFTRLCESVGIVTGSAHIVPPAPASPPAKKWKQKAAAENGDGFLTAVSAPAGPGLARDAPFWINLAEEEAVSDALEGLPLEAVGVTTSGTGRKALYSKADVAITKFVSDPASEVVYHDDPNWDVFPSIASALKRAKCPEECLCVAVCSSLGVWAVGVGMKGKNRSMAAKAALAAAIAMQLGDAGEEVDFSEFQALSDFVEEARAAKASALEAAAG